ncbi:MAG: hypothetical protein ACO3A2_11455 [Bdellovibrionia bacterium]
MSPQFVDQKKSAFNPFQAILACILPQSDFTTDSNFLHSFLQLGKQFQAELHILVPEEKLPFIQKILPWPSLNNLVVHPFLPPLQSEQVQKKATTYDCGLILMSQPHSLSNDESGTHQSILTQSTQPVLLVPTDRDLSTHPITSVLVPLSGEERSSQALTLALQLAERLRLPVDLIHVCSHSSTDEPCPHGPKPSTLLALECLSDSFQHEYPQLKDTIVAEACPFSTTSQRNQVRSFTSCQGETSQQLTHCLDHHRNALVIVEWRGNLHNGHALNLKAINDQQKFPFFCVRVSPAPQTRLKVGAQF